METETLIITKVESPNWPVIEPKEENDSQFDQSELGSWREDQKYINCNYYGHDKSLLKFETIEEEEVHIKHEDEEDNSNDKKYKDERSNDEFASIKTRDEMEKLYKKKSGFFKSEADQSNGRHIDEELDDGVMTITEQCAIKSEINNENGRVEQFTRKPGNHQCPECPYRTIFKCYLKIHQITHKRPEEIDWFVCQECPYKTPRRGNLKTHAEKHNNLILKCSKCSYETFRATSLKKHQIKHNTNAQWVHCPDCSYKTHLQSYLRKHSMVHKSDAFKCSKCSYQARTKQQLTVHQVKHESMDKWHSCPSCSFKTYDKYTIKKHCRRHLNALSI